MRAGYPCRSGRFLPSVATSRPEDLPVDLEQRIDKIILKSLICHVLAGVHELGKISFEQNHPVAFKAETFSEKEHDAAGCHVIIEQTFGR